MAGGRGTRFWPRSRGKRPKQFLTMVGEESLLHQTVHRLDGAFRPEDIFVLTTEELAEETRRMLPELPPRNVLVEPEGRNTAPCLALALVAMEQRVPGGVMVVLSADSWIGDRAKFLKDIDTAVNHAAEKRDLVTFGIRPTYPETGYGYIETEGKGAVLGVTAFREKPSYEKAVEYLESGQPLLERRHVRLDPAGFPRGAARATARRSSAPWTTGWPPGRPRRPWPRPTGACPSCPSTTR